jgi:urocanate hydratase
MVKWINLARRALPIEGLPAASATWASGAQGVRTEVSRMVQSGELAGPVAFSRDNLDSGSIVNPTFESEKMKDGGDLISDWPYLNALLNTASGWPTWWRSRPTTPWARRCTPA